MFPKIKIRVQRNKLLFNCANIFRKKAPKDAHIPPNCAKNWVFFNIFFWKMVTQVVFSWFYFAFHNSIILGKNAQKFGFSLE